jgi:putative flippase GtrA
MRALFHKIYAHNVFRYFVAAGTATVVDLTVYYLVFHHVFYGEMFLKFNTFEISIPSICLIVSFSCGLVTNFTISKYFVFKDSQLKTSTQFMRFLIVAVLILLANITFMNFLIKIVGIFPTISRAISAVIIGLFSFILHKAFSFKTEKKDSEDDLFS